MTPEMPSQDYREAFTRGQRDFLIMGFPIRHGGHDFDHYREAKTRYEACLEHILVCACAHAQASDGFMGYPDGADSIVVEMEQLLAKGGAPCAS